MPTSALPALLLAGAVLLTGCGGTERAQQRPAPDSVQVVTTVAPITSIVAAVVADRAVVTGLIPEGTDSHTFEPAPQAGRVLERADVVFVNGLHLEEAVVELASASAPDATLVRLGDEVLPESEYLFDFSFPAEHGRPNPHLWTDPTYAIRYAQVVARVMSERDPAHADAYSAGLQAFTARATALSDALRADQETIPDGSRQLLTYHDAYAYFARTYGWTVVGAVQPSSFEDPQPREVARIVDQVRTARVPVLFGSEVFPSPVLEQIARETGARYEDTLRDDDLPGAPGDPEHSWLGLMRDNYVTMIRGLGGSTASLDALDVSAAVPDTASYPQ